MNETIYTDNEVRKLLNGASIILENQPLLNPDDDTLLGIYDIQQASKKLNEKNFSLFQDIVEGKSVNEIANEQHTYEKKIFRRKKALVKTLTTILNKG